MKEAEWSCLFSMGTYFYDFVMQMHGGNCFSEGAEHFGQIDSRHSGLAFSSYSCHMQMNVNAVVLFFSSCFLLEKAPLK